MGVTSPTWTVIRLSVATRLYAAASLRFGVSSSAPNGCLSRVMTWSPRICLSVRDNSEGGLRGAASREKAVGHPPNDCPRRATSHAVRVCGPADAIGRVREWQLANRRRPVVWVLFGYRLCYTFDRLSVNEKANPRMNKVHRTESRQILLGLQP